MPNPKGHEDSIKDSRFKAAWQSGPTRTIRVPIALADATLEYARQLDQGTEPRDTSELLDFETSTAAIEPRDTVGSMDSEVKVKVALTPDTSDLSDERFAHALTTPEEALAHAAIFGFTPEEALADAHFQIAMLESNYDGLEDRHKAAKTEVAELRSQLETERADRQEVERQLSELQQNSAPAATLSEKPTPDAATILSKLRAKRKKSKVELADLEVILEILGN